MTNYAFKIRLMAVGLITPFMLLSACEQTTRSTAGGNAAGNATGNTAANSENNAQITAQTPSSDSNIGSGSAPLNSSQNEQQNAQHRAANPLGAGQTGPTVQQAKEFLENTELHLERLNAYASRIAWVNSNFITDDTNWLYTDVMANYAKSLARIAKEASYFNEIKLPADMTRKMDILKRGSNFPAPDREGAAQDLAAIETNLQTQYATGTFAYRSDDKQFASFYEGLDEKQTPELTLGQLSDIMAKSRDPKELQTIWEGWREIAPPMRDEYARMASIANEGARELGFEDTGALWRAGYDMPADEFTAEADRLWSQVKPLYDELHCYVRAELNAEYGDEVVPLGQPIRADILGNMWGQSWGNIYDIVRPDSPPSNIDVTKLLESAKYTPLKMVETGESFFSSLGFEELPETFWTRSLFTKPEDRDVACHASAWNLDDKDDMRIKMCTKVNSEDFQTVHHELGHNYYQRAYKDQPVYYRTGANDGFHEAIGDMIALSITPDYLVRIGLMEEGDIPSAESDIDLLMQQALEKIAFLPFGLLVDKWRWQVFSGELSPEQYNEGWWDLREQYQGLRAPSERSEAAFDPGAKYHIPGNTPYMRYFLAHILQFQFHQAACEIAEFDGPLHRCSIYDEQEVGARFNAMMEMGASRPWPDALEAFTGTRSMDGAAIIAYFAPLMSYLKAENEDRQCGWNNQ